MARPVTKIRLDVAAADTEITPAEFTEATLILQRAAERRLARLAQEQERQQQDSSATTKP